MAFFCARIRLQETLGWISLDLSIHPKGALTLVVKVQGKPGWADLVMDNALCCI